MKKNKLYISIFFYCVVFLSFNCKQECKEYISSGLFININEDEYEITKAKLDTFTNLVTKVKNYKFELIAYDTDCSNYIELDFSIAVNHTNPLNEEFQIVDTMMLINMAYSAIYYNDFDKNCLCSFFSKGTSGTFKIIDEGNNLFFIELNGYYTDFNYRFKERIQFNN